LSSEKSHKNKYRSKEVNCDIQIDIFSPVKTERK
jgi:hypothetical protein